MAIIDGAVGVGTDRCRPQPRVMESFHGLWPIAVAALLSAFLPAAHAHDPGLSRVDLTAGDRALKVHIVYARRDIEWVVPLDTDRDGVIGEQEWQAGREKLISFGQASLSVTLDERTLMPSSSDVSRDDSDGIHFWMGYPLPDGGTLSVASDVPARLALGHRQFVTLTDGRDEVHTGILSAELAELSFALGQPDRGRQFFGYLRDGIHHIWIGYDHILFLLALLLTCPMRVAAGTWIPRASFKPAAVDVIKIVTAFTLAHSLTLVLSVFELIKLPARVVEPAIAASVIIAAATNLFPRLNHLRWHLGFSFGLIHGLGFAGVLLDLGLPSGARGVSLVAFNLGVEGGQLAIVALALPVLFALRTMRCFPRAVIGTGSLGISVVAAVWLVERAAEVDLTAWL
ncbi:MAG: HupE/UreJ family protein [Pseudomonadota bacterium]